MVTVDDMRSTVVSHRPGEDQTRGFLSICVLLQPERDICCSETRAMAMRSSFRGVSRLLLQQQARYAGSIATQSETSVVRHGAPPKSPIALCT